MTAERFNSALLFVLLSAMPSAVWAGQEAALRPASATAAKAPEVSPKPDAIHAKKSEGAGGSLDGREFRETRLGLSLLQNIARDQREIWTSPERLRFSDLQWLVPVGGFAAGLLVTDRDTSGHLSRNPQTIRRYNNVANAGVAGLIGVAGGLSLWSLRSHNAHWRETGYLAGEAAINSLLLVETAKYSLRRERPFQGNDSGHFFQGGGTSFPSEHAAAAWSIAGVIAHEYPGPLTKLMAYGLASAVSFSRVRARQHFLSDVFIGGMIGNLVAQQVYSRHHDPELGGGEWRPIGEFFRGEGSSSPANQGSPYVPLDSWVYPALDRLAARGYVHSAILGMRPWTRLECARLLNEADELLHTADSEDQEALRLYDSLAREFSGDLALLGGGKNQRLQVESLYTRVTGISGTPLTNGYYFGRTIVNDLGRPFAEGFNTVNGFSGWASEGRLTVYVRGEYQHAPSSPALSAQARQVISGFDGLPVPPNSATPAVDRFQLLDAYIAMNIENWQLSFGKQSLWWGPNKGGPMMFSDNAAPVTMFKIDRVSPLKLPWVLGLMGPMRMQFILGRLSGQEFVYGVSTGEVGQWGSSLNPQPMIDGVKLNFKPTPNFEFGIDFTTLFGGPGVPFTLHSFVKSMIGLGNGPYGNRSDPGDRRSGIDFSYRIPKLRRWLTLYGDAFTEDEFSPLGYPRKSAYEGGIYMPQIPGIQKLDLRLEGGSTVPPDFPDCNGCFYVNGRFRSGYTNLGNLMGSWLGRAGQGERMWSTYWLTSRNTIQVNYRHQKTSGEFLPQGGTLNDGGVRAEFWLGTSIRVSASVQYEKWNYPVLDPLPRSNVTTSIELGFWPRHWGLQAQ